MGDGNFDDAVNAIRDFPSKIQELASRISQADDGPFPLCHGDFYHSSMIVNHQFNVIAVIDWECIYTLPWELVPFPGFICAMPPEFATPKPCGEQGTPLSKEERQRREDRKFYINMLKMAENEDNLLPRQLADRKSSALAYSLGSTPGEN